MSLRARSAIISPSTDDLAAAVANDVMAMLRMPGPDIFDGVDGAPARVAALARAMAAYYERSQPWYRMAELDDRPVDGVGRGARPLRGRVRGARPGALLGRRPATTWWAVVAAMLDPGVFVRARLARGTSMVDAR